MSKKHIFLLFALNISNIFAMNNNNIRFLSLQGSASSEDPTEFIFQPISCYDPDDHDVKTKTLLNKINELRPQSSNLDDFYNTYHETYNRLNKNQNGRIGKILRRVFYCYCAAKLTSCAYQSFEQGFRYFFMHQQMFQPDIIQTARTGAFVCLLGICIGSLATYESLYSGYAHLKKYNNESRIKNSIAPSFQYQ